MKKIVFDLDGTLLDSRKRHILVLQRIDNDLKEIYASNSDYDFSDYFECKRNGMSTFRYLVDCKNFSEEVARVYSLKWIELIEAEEFLKEDVLYSDSIAILKRLKSLNQYELYLITARANEIGLRKQLNDFDLTKYFTEIYCVSPKYAKDEKVKVARNLTHVILWVGDTEVDWQAANSISTEFYALNRGFRDRSYWEKNNVKSHQDMTRFEEKLREL